MTPINIPQKYWFLRAKDKQDLKRLSDDQRRMLTRVEYLSENNVTYAKLRLQRILGTELVIEHESRKVA
jgi:hypothetical protein